MCLIEEKKQGAACLGDSIVSGGRPVRVLVALSGVVVASGSPTITVAIQAGSDNSTFGTTLDSSGALAGSDLQASAGYQFDLFLPEGPCPRYLQMYYTVGGAGSFASMAVTAGLYAGGRQSNRIW